MQEILSLTLGMFLALIQFAILCLAGFLFYKMKWLKQEAIDGINSLIRKFLFPCILITEIVKVVKVESAGQDWIIVFIPFLSLLVNLLVGFLFSIILRTDYRVRLLYIMTTVSGNSGQLSSILVRSSCQSGGILYENVYCDEGWGYIMLSQIPQIFCLFIFSLSLFFKEGQYAKKINAKLSLILTVYHTRKELLQDRDLTQITEATSKNRSFSDQNQDRSLVESKGEVQNERINAEIFKRLNSAKELQLIDQAFDKLILTKQSAIVRQYTIQTQSLCKITATKMCSAINITLIAVCLLSLIEPVRQFVLREDGVIPMFRDTLQQCAMTGVVLLSVLFGSSLGSLSFKVKDKYIGKREVCGLLLTKFLIVPTIGLFILRLFSANFKVLEENAVLGFVMFSHWVCPIGIMMSVLAISSKHGTKDVSYLSFWQYVFMPLPIIVFVSLHQSLNY